MAYVTDMPTGPPTMGEGARTGWALAIIAVLLAAAVYCAVSNWEEAVVVEPVEPAEPVEFEEMEGESEPQGRSAPPVGSDA